jgi:hypothetical protein
VFIGAPFVEVVRAIDEVDDIAGAAGDGAFIATNRREFGTAPAAKPETAPPRSRRCRERL